VRPNVMSYLAARRILVGFLAASIAATAQIGGPLPSPQGRAPGGPGTGPGTGTGTGLPPMPRIGNKNKKKTGPKKKIDESKVLIEGVRGRLRRLTETSIVIFTDDKRFLQIEREDETRFLKTSQDAMMADFTPGVSVWIEGYRDDDGAYHALRVNWEKAATEDERAIAMGPLPQSVQFEDDRPAAEVAREAKGKQDVPPKMSRKEQAVAKASSEPAAAPSATPKAAETVAAQAETPRDNSTLVVEKAPDLIEAPKVRRGRPAPRPRDPVDDVAAEAPVASAGGERLADNPETLAGALKVASPPAAPDPLIDQAREIALEFEESLPNYLAKQVTTRFAGNGKKDRWNAQDNFTADVVYENGKESYRNVQLNGKPAKGKIEQTGAWSRGEFGTTLRDLMAPSTNAKFKLRGTTTISNRRAKYFDYTVEQENSHWQIGIPGQTYFPAYKGSVWIDVETARVMRIEMQGRQIPQTFPIETVESAVEWEFVKIVARSYLVPVHAETLSCWRSTSECSKNVMDFRNYRKFGAESDLILENPPQ
jgi:hypothetical protein